MKKSFQLVFLASFLVNACIFKSSQSQALEKDQSSESQKFACKNDLLSVSGSLLSDNSLQKVDLEEISPSLVMLIKPWQFESADAQAHGSLLNGSPEFAPYKQTHLFYDLTAPDEAQEDLQSPWYTFLALPKDMRSLKAGEEFQAVSHIYNMHLEKPVRPLDCKIVK